MALPDAQFDLSQEARRIEAPSRSTERAGDAIAAGFAVIGVAILAFFLEHTRPSRVCFERYCWRSTPPEYYAVYGLLLAIFFGAAIVAFATSRRHRLAAPTQLRISDDGLHFEVPGGRDLLVPWPVGLESFVVVDQRSALGSRSRRGAIEGMLPIPPGTRTAALSGDAIDAILARARDRGLGVETRHREADRSAGGLQPVEEYRVTRSAGAGSKATPTARTASRSPAGTPASRELPPTSDSGYNPS
jgi:hypothetical protein